MRAVVHAVRFLVRVNQALTLADQYKEAEADFKEAVPLFMESCATIHNIAGRDLPEPPHDDRAGAGVVEEDTRSGVETTGGRPCNKIHPPRRTLGDGGK